ncbi:hypothetical protein L227DRAFT_657602 [Lentinus tigrinus ALCF2SS1-6]|uniref:Uncharacterized protein n=1 Tax=Lentinus tigrinus ALCF2SS1-6 TaxID=1328759 RepID=A0A5C2RVX2_9APHY|nr:hypothetical protein L227DRAFT_657602 [Lentinus tigrinus ALCF2SS1-6]
MTSEDISDEIYLGALYFRTTHLSPQFISAHQKSIRLREIYIPHRPSRERAQAFQGYTGVYAALTQCPGAFEVNLAGWCESLLDAEGFRVSRLAADEEGAIGLGGKRGFEVSRGDHTFQIQLDACACFEGAGAQRWLRVLVVASRAGGNATAEKTRALSSSSELSHRAFTVRHMLDHPHHVCSWSFAAGLASQRFHLDFVDGTSWTIQLTLGLLGTADDTQLRRSFVLGVEILSQPSKETERTPHRPSMSSQWVPPMTILDPQAVK